jgi:predicted phosphodiesterase
MASASGRSTPYQPRPGSHLVMVLPDLHLPHHDSAALECAMKVHALLKPRKTVILGDWLDCEAFSAHPVKSELEERSQTFFEAEIEPCRALLTRLEKNTEEIVYLEGNHEFRVERTVISMGGVMRDLADLVSPRRLLSEGRTKPFTYIPYVQKAQQLSHHKIAEDLIAVHGWTWCRHAAAKHLEQAKHYSVVFGHIHRAQTATSRDPISGKHYQAWSPGCLSRLQPLYMASTPTDWVHGFSLIWVRDDGSAWTAYSPIIVNGVTVLPDGRKVRG